MTDTLTSDERHVGVGGPGPESDAVAPGLMLLPGGTTDLVGTRPGRIAKRTLDLVFALGLLVLLSPLLVALVVAVRLTSPGPVLFRQARVGRGGRTFTVLKFRTMVADAEERLQADPALAAEYRSHGYKLAVDRDPRITPMGRVLRRTSLDELPQLLNVVAGSMSLVGPRPVLDVELGAVYDAAGRRAYLAVRPGMTGLWQVSGRSRLTHADRVSLDVAYVHSWSLGRDLVLMVRTIPAVLRGVGAH